MTGNDTDEHGHDLLRRLGSRHGATFNAALLDAASDAQHGEQSLLQSLPLVPRTRLPLVLAALGDVQRSGHTDAILQAALRGSRDARSTALVTLARREGVYATPDLLQGLGSRGVVVKDYALLCLAVVGDQRVWNAMHHRFAQLVKRPAGGDADSWAADEDLAARIRLYSPTDLGGAGLPHQPRHPIPGPDAGAPTPP